MSFDEKPKKTKNTQLILLLIFLLLGALIQHYVIEPVFNTVQSQRIQELTQENNALNRENIACITEKTQLEQQLQMSS